MIKQVFEFCGCSYFFTQKIYPIHRFAFEKQSFQSFRLISMLNKRNFISTAFELNSVLWLKMCQRRCLNVMFLIRWKGWMSAWRIVLWSVLFQNIMENSFPEDLIMTDFVLIPKSSTQSPVALRYFCRMVTTHQYSGISPNNMWFCLDMD